MAQFNHTYGYPCKLDSSTQKTMQKHERYRCYQSQTQTLSSSQKQHVHSSSTSQGGVLQQRIPPIAGGAILWPTMPVSFYGKIDHDFVAVTVIYITDPSFAKFKIERNRLDLVENVFMPSSLFSESI